MATKLPRTVRLKVERALAKFAHWTGVPAGDPTPVPVQILGNELNNCSVLVANERGYVIRVNRRRHTSNSLDPEAETLALNRAALAGLAPPLRYSDPRLGTLVCDYLEPDGDQSVAMPALAGLLRGIHGLPAISHVLSLPARIRYYEKNLPEAIGQPRAQALMKKYSERAMACARGLHDTTEARVLCHNDLLPQNLVVSGGRLWAIDWEYAAMGSRWFDIAAACCGARLDTARSWQLLEHYLRHPPRPPEMQRFQWGRVSYRYIEWLWYACNQPAADLDALETELVSELNQCVDPGPAGPGS